MDFAYSIDEYIPADNMFYVLYTPMPSTGLLPRALSVQVPPSVVLAHDQAAVRQAVINNAPVGEWVQEEIMADDDLSDFLQDLSGTYEAKSTPVPHPTTDFNVEKPDPAAPVDDNPGIEPNYYSNKLLTPEERLALVQNRHKAVRREGYITIYTYVNEHSPVFDPDVVGAPYDEQRVWIHLVRAEAQAKIDAVTDSTDPWDLEFDAVNHLPPSLVL